MAMTTIRWFTPIATGFTPAAPSLTSRAIRCSAPARNCASPDPAVTGHRRRLHGRGAAGPGRRPGHLTLARTVAPVRAGDRLFEFEPEPNSTASNPSGPPDTEGFILANLDSDVTQITQYSSVIINLGAQEGLEPATSSPFTARIGRSKTRSPRNCESARRALGPVDGLQGSRSGQLRLVMQAERFIRLQDRVTTP